VTFVNAVVCHTQENKAARTDRERCLLLAYRMGEGDFHPSNDSSCSKRARVSFIINKRCKEEENLHL
jgi:hypothetical protein